MPFSLSSQSPAVFLTRVLTSAAVFLALLTAAAPVRAAEGVTGADKRVAEQIIEAMDEERWDHARRLLSRLQAPVARAAMTWHLLMNPNSGASFAMITSFYATAGHWPRRRTLRLNAELAATDSVKPARLAAWFDKHPPLTDQAHILYIDALAKLGRSDKAAKEARRAWTQSALAGSAQRQFFQSYGRYLRASDHQARLLYLLRRRAYRVTRDLMNLVSFSKTDKLIAETRILMRTKKNRASIRRINANLKRLPSSAPYEPDFLYDTLIWHMRTERSAQAHRVLEDAPTEPLFARRWWRKRNLLVRESLEKGELRLAYQLARDHRQTAGADFADAEWLAGWIALRNLKNPARALSHFTRLFATSGYAISRSRGAYWAGRAARAKGDKAAAQSWFRKAAQYPTTYYGQLAIIEMGGRRLNLPVDVVVGPTERAAFYDQRLVEAALLFADLNESAGLRHILRHLLQRANTGGQRALVAELSISLDQRDIAVRVVKRALGESQAVLRGGYPRVVLPSGSRVEPALIFALIRQESEFFAEAMSPVGARGLMQLMPRTARREARALRMRYSRARLTSDAAYNVRLGTHHMNRLLERFDGSYVLAIAAYNAGASRAKQWMERFGDPRSDKVDVIDWIEKIPFNETRNYVQRVLENLHIYRVFTDRNALSPALIALWTSPNHR